MKEEETLRERMREPEPRIELIATVLMSIAIALSAYCAYEATRWGGVQSIDFATASTYRVESTKSASTANQQLSYDASTLLSLSEVYLQGETAVVTELGGRFLRDEFRPFVDQWMALDPLNNPDAPDTPFEMPGFVNKEQEHAKQLDQEAAIKFQEAQEANQNGDDYVMATVFFALVLFFAGISTKLDYIFLQRLVLIFGTIGLLMGFVRMLTLPFH